MFYVTCLAAYSAGAANEFWISPDPAPSLPSIQAAFLVGTVQNPYDGSTASRFDSVMSIIPTNSTIHLLAGRFQTMGFQGYSLKTGQRVVGAGIYQTTVQLLPVAAYGDYVMGTQSDTNITISDLTVDCNYQPKSVITLNGISLHGSGNAIDRVRLINAASVTESPTNYVEAWGLIIASFPFPDATGNRISDCIIEHFHGNFSNNLTGLGLPENNSGWITGNRVVQDGQQYIYGFYPGSHDTVISGNILNCVIGSHIDSQTGVTNDIITSNQFVGVSAAIDWANGFYSGTTFTDNNITLTNDGSGRFTTIAFYFQPGSTNVNLSIHGNQAKTLGNFPNARFIVGTLTSPNIYGNFGDTNLVSDQNR